MHYHAPGWVGSGEVVQGADNVYCLRNNERGKLSQLEKYLSHEYGDTIQIYSTIDQMQRITNVIENSLEEEKFVPPLLRCGTGT